MGIAHRALCIGCVAALLTTGVAAGDTFEEIRLPARREVILLRRPTAVAVGREDGVLLAARGQPVTVVLPDKEWPLLTMAAEDLRVYLNAAVGARVMIQRAADIVPERCAGTLICVGPIESRALKPTNFACEPQTEDTFEIVCRPAFPNDAANTVWISGRHSASERAAFYGVTELLHRSLGARWLPPRVYPGLEETAFLETHLITRDHVFWPEETIRSSPILSDRGVYTNTRHLVRPTLGWLVRNRINILTLSVTHDYPLPELEQHRLKAMIHRAHQFGMDVLMIAFTHNVSEESKKAHAEILSEGKIDPTQAITKQESVRLFVDLVKYYDLDGFAWHSATEGIKIASSDVLKSKARPAWEADYFKAYREAIRSDRPDARLVMLMGWVYMNPASLMADLYPPDTIAWVVPNTPIIDAANTDLEAYSKRFHCWYWLYVTVSRDAQFPVVKTDYLETYIRDAIARGNGLMPQSAFLGNTFNLQYVAECAWGGAVPSGAFIQDYAGMFFADSSAAQASLDAYTRVTTRYRNWTNNLHTRKVQITQADFEDLKAAYDGFMAAYEQAPTPLVRDRIRDFAIAALRAFKRYPGLEPAQRLALLETASQALGTRPLDSETDFYGQVLQEELHQASSKPAVP